MHAGPTRLFVVAVAGAFSDPFPLDIEVWTRVFYPEGWRNDATINEYLPLVNPNPFPVNYRVVARYEVGERDEVIAEGVLAPLSRGGITTTERSRPQAALVRLNVGYALEVQSSGPIGAMFSHYDNFGSDPGATRGTATGEAFSSTRSEFRTLRRPRRSGTTSWCSTTRSRLTRR